MKGWQVSGITSYISGPPITAGFSLVNPIDITGSPSQGARIDITGNPFLPSNERTFSRNFKTEVFRAPARGTVGNSSRYTMRGPSFPELGYGLVQEHPAPGTVEVPIPLGDV